MLRKHLRMQNQKEERPQGFKEAEQKAEGGEKAAKKRHNNRKNNRRRRLQTGQAIVDYACQFIGNPVCMGRYNLHKRRRIVRGSVQSVFAHFEFLFHAYDVGYGEM